MEPRAALHAAILNYLDSARGAAGDAESIEVAMTCLAESWAVDQAARAAVGDKVDLLKLVTAHLAAAAPAPAPKAAAPAPASPASVSSPAADVAALEASPLFQKYLAMATEKGVFKGAAKGTAEWNATYAKVIETYRKKVEGAAGGGGGGAASPAAGGAGGKAARPAVAAAAPASGGAAPVSEADEAAAEKLKSEGNAHITAGRYEEAIDCYTAALARVRNGGKSAHILFANRAAAKTSAGDAAGAVEDANASIAANPTFAKGYARLGAAHQALKSYADAVSAYERALELDPSSTVTRDNLAAAKAALRSSGSAASRGAASAAATATASAGRASAAASAAPAKPAGGFPGFPGFGGGGSGGGGGGGGLADLMSNPMLAGLMSNPEVMRMAQGVMSNPAMMQSMMGMMGGMGA